jgi:hypothetical protein
MIKPVYKFELSVEGFSKTTKFKTRPSNAEIERGLSALLSGVYLYDDGNFDDDNSEANENHAYDVWNSFLQKDFTDVEENWLDRDINQNSNYEKLAPDPRSGPIWW